jgi:hypothetical protein
MFFFFLFRYKTLNVLHYTNKTQSIFESNIFNNILRKFELRKSAEK